MTQQDSEEGLKANARGGFTRRSFMTIAAVGLGGSAISSGFRTQAMAANTSVAESAVQASVTRRVITELNNLRVPEAGTLFTPIWSDAEAIYVAGTVYPETPHSYDPEWGTLKVVRCPKNLAQPVTSSTVGTFLWDMANYGHIGASIAVTDRGTVLTHPSSHGSSSASGVGLAMYRSPTPHSIDEWELVPSPPSVREASYYRRFFRDPYSGTIYMVARGNEFQTLLYRWQDDKQTFSRIDRPNTFRSDGAAPVREGLAHPRIADQRKLAVYGHDLAFAQGPNGSSIMYCVPEFMISMNNETNGSPRRDISIMRSDDGGHSWRKPGRLPSGDPQPIQTETFHPRMPNPVNPSQWLEGNVLTVFPGPAFDASTPHDRRNNATLARVGVTAGGAPVVVANWADPREFPEPPEQNLLDAVRLRSIWAVRIDPDTGQPDEPVKLLQNFPNHHTGFTSVAYTRSGFIVVLGAEAADHMLDGTSYVLSDLNDNEVPYPSGARFFAFTSRDGISWTRHLIDDGRPIGEGGTGGICSANIDAESLERDGLLRIFPLFPSTPARSEIWEIRNLDGIATVNRRSQQAAAPTLRALSFGNRSNLSWDIASTGGASLVHYAVQRAPGVAGPTSSWAANLGFHPSRGNGMVDNLGSSGSTFSYRVFSNSSRGNSPFSAPVTIQSQEIPARPETPNTHAPSDWFQPEQLVRHGTYQAIGVWSNAQPGGQPAVVRDPSLRGPGSWNLPLDTRPRLVCDGPGGYPALRFNRGANSQLLLEVPEANSAGNITVFTVARVNDHKWSTLISHAGANGRMVRWGPHSRTSSTNHQTHYASEYFDLPENTSQIPYSHHRVWAEFGVGPWKVFVSRWENGGGYIRRCFGQINRCCSHMEYNTPTLGDLDKGSEYVPYRFEVWGGGVHPALGRHAAPDVPHISPASPVPTGITHMTIGSAVSIDGSKTHSSSADIAEVVRFNRVLNRGDTQKWVDYLLSVYGIPMTNAVPLDKSAATMVNGSPWNDQYPHSCIYNVTESDLPHPHCGSVMRSYPWTPPGQESAVLG